MTTILSTAWAQGVPAARRSFAIVLTVSFFILHSPYAPAQSTDSISVDSFYFQLQAAGGPYFAGDTIEFTCLLGKANAEVVRASGIELDIELSGLAKMPGTTSMDLSRSWLIDDPHFESSVTENASSLKLSVHRTDGMHRTGGGEILRFSILAAQAVDSAGQLLETVGGMVMIENLDMKTMLEEVEEEGIQNENAFQLYPNPARERFFIRNQGEGEMRFEVLGMDGRLLDGGDLPVASLHAIDFGSATGPAVIRIHFSDGEVTSRVVLRRP